MIHRNAPLTPTGRLRLARCVVEDGWPLRRAAERFQVSHTTAARWAQRYRHHGAAGMSDRSSRPHHSPRRTPAHVEERVPRMRREHHIGSLRPAARACVTASTAHRILQRHGLPPLAACDRTTGEPVRRYERSRPGELVHIDVKKLGRIPDGGGHKALGRPAVRTPGSRPAVTWASAPASPAPGDHRQTAKSNASTAPCWTNGPTSSPTPQKANARQRSPTGWTGTTTTDPTPESAATPQPAASPTCPVSTPSSSQARVASVSWHARRGRSSRSALARRGAR